MFGGQLRCPSAGTICSTFSGATEALRTYAGLEVALGRNAPGEYAMCSCMTRSAGTPFYDQSKQGLDGMRRNLRRDVCFG